ncbi:hypothetical protein [Leptospira jelokensis]|uniref:Uncharacterized protein n=1 Tax=Leptospira jelokensis TaxID=2484931 RepID=A0A4Z1A349_9LEPT|nr:hypothetical protein [Leptospira jelokensis]TGL74029.1 hypothetical protein EHQ62_03445 [Leptospira jelokensis]
MSLINLSLNRFDSCKPKVCQLVCSFVLVLSSVFIFQCKEKESLVFQFCDNFNEALDCTEPKTENDLVFLDQTKFKKENPSFEDFGNFLYFTARETPGIRVEFTNPWNGVEAYEFKSNYHAYLSYGSSKERMEGNQLKPHTVVSFHYLGALLKEEFRHTGIASKPFRMETLGDIHLTYVIEIPGQKPITKERTLRLQWK